MAPADQEQVKQIIKEAMTESLVAFFGPNKSFGDLKNKTDAVGKQYTPKQGSNGSKPIKYEIEEET